MKRFAAVVLVLSILLLGVGIVSSVSASVEDFSFSKFQADYYLSKDEGGRSRMKVVERLTAQFPTYQQNKGIIRAIPMSYDGHSVSLVFDDSSLTRNGVSEAVYDKEVSNGNLEVSTGTESYVLGEQTYEFSYTLRDVIKDFGDHQELYWDTNGTGWRQSFDAVVARVHIDSSLREAWTEEQICYQGVQNSRQQCKVTTNEGDGETLVTFQSTRAMGPGENLSFVIGFEPGTFRPYEPSLSDYANFGLRLGLIALSIGVMVWAIVWKVGRARDARGRGTIVPEYLPPDGIALLAVSELYGSRSHKPVAAQIVDLAVRHNVQIIEYEKPGIFGKKKAYKLRFISESGLNEDERTFLQVLFSTLTKGAEYEIGSPSDSSRIGLLLASFNRKLAASMVSREYRRKVPGRSWPIVIAIVLFVVAILINSVFPAIDTVGVIDAATFVSTFASIFVTIFLLGGTLPVTEKGAAVRDYLKGLEMYIKVAEADRLKILQSVKGAARKTIGDVTDQSQLVKLYERVLPYAILLGLESSWGKVLEQYYDSATTPSWYSGTGAFSVSSFSSSLSSFASATNSSSSGFSGGGGSGGGGGGGGGGGR